VEMLLLSATPRLPLGESFMCLNVSAAAMCCVVVVLPRYCGFLEFRCLDLHSDMFFPLL